MPALGFHPCHFSDFQSQDGRTCLPARSIDSQIDAVGQETQLVPVGSNGGYTSGNLLKAQLRQAFQKAFANLFLRKTTAIHSCIQWQGELTGSLREGIISWLVAQAQHLIGVGKPPMRTGTQSA